MALFGIGKKKHDSGKEKPQKEAVDERAAPQTLAPVSISVGAAPVLLGQRVTEKASILSERSNVYTFNITNDATKRSVADSVVRLYKVHPVKIRIVRVPAKRVFVRGKNGVKAGGRKAYVYLKAGEKIDIS